MEAMEADTTQTSPEADALRVEMHDIASNPQNPLNRGYHRGEPAVMRAIDAKYAKVYGTAPVVIGDGTIGGVEPRPLDGEDEATPAPAEAEGLSREDATVWAPALEKLQADWGADFQPRMETVQAGLEVLDKHLGDDMADRLKDAFVKAGGDPTLVYKIGEELGRK